MRKITVKCEECGENHVVSIPSTCSKSCGAIARERRHHRLRNRKVVTPRDFLTRPTIGIV